jgi:hypothetical protein
MSAGDGKSAWLTPKHSEALHVIPRHHLRVFKTRAKCSNISAFQGSFKSIKNNAIGSITDRMNIL